MEKPSNLLLTLCIADFQAEELSWFLSLSLHDKLYKFSSFLCHMFSIIFQFHFHFHDAPVTLMDLDGETCETSQLGEVVPHQAL